MPLCLEPRSEGKAKGCNKRMRSRIEGVKQDKAVQCATATMALNTDDHPRQVINILLLHWEFS